MEFLWEDVLRNIKGRISKPSYETWFKNTKAEIEGDVLTVFALNSFGKDWLESQYGNMIMHTVEKVAGQSYKIFFATNSEKENAGIESRSSILDDTYDLMSSRNDLIKKQQEKIDELEKRIQVLEQKLEV